MTSNYRIWSKVTEYIEQCGDILSDKMEAAKTIEKIKILEREYRGL